MIKTLNNERDFILAQFDLIAEHGDQATKWSHADWMRAMDRRIVEIRARNLSHVDWIRAMVAALNEVRRASMQFVEEPRGMVNAQINHGRWLADCPACHGAELVEPGNAFYCFSCGNESNGGHPYTVVMPANRLQIEDALSVRSVNNRNWGGETVEQMQAENKANGLEAL